MIFGSMSCRLSRNTTVFLRVFLTSGPSQFPPSGRRRCVTADGGVRPNRGLWLRVRGPGRPAKKIFAFLLTFLLKFPCLNQLSNRSMRSTHRTTKNHAHANRMQHTVTLTTQARPVQEQLAHLASRRVAARSARAVPGRRSATRSATRSVHAAAATPRASPSRCCSAHCTRAAERRSMVTPIYVS